MPFTGSFEIFRKNFCVRGSDTATERLHSFLNIMMLRRTNLDTLFGVPLLKLPETEQQTTELEFSDVERLIYQVVKARFITRINGFVASSIFFRGGADIQAVTLPQACWKSATVIFLL